MTKGDMDSYLLDENQDEDSENYYDESSLFDDSSDDDSFDDIDE